VGITPLQIVYEDMVADFGGTVRAVLRHIGVNAEHIAIPTPTLQRQADALSEAWERQYRSIGAMFVRARAQHRKAARAGGSRLHHPAQMPEPAASSSSGPNEMTSRRLIAYEIDPQNKLPIVVASRERPWMQRTPQRFANRCLPMLIANQSGWHILNTRKIAVTWDGGVGTENLRVEFIDGETSPFVGSHFGSGILTWNIPYLFRTSPHVYDELADDAAAFHGALRRERADRADRAATPRRARKFPAGNATDFRQSRPPQSP
jgi:hypothetical protein